MSHLLSLSPSHVSHKNKQLFQFHFTQIFPKMISWRFLRFLKYLGIFTSINKGSQRLKNLEIMKMLGFSSAHDEIEKL